jgi:hypothetical protein
LNWLWLALAYQKLGEKDKARTWLAKAAEWLDSLGNQMPPPIKANEMNLHLHNWLEAQILRREAEKLLYSPADK